MQIANWKMQIEKSKPNAIPAQPPAETVTVLAVLDSTPQNGIHWAGRIKKYENIDKMVSIWILYRYGIIDTPHGQEQNPGHPTESE